MARVIAIGAGITGMAAAIGLRRLNLETLMRPESSEECLSWKVISPAEAGSVLESALYHRLKLNALRRLAEFAPYLHCDAE